MASKSEARPGYDTLDTLFRHNLWANARLFEVCLGLNEKQLDTSIVGGYGSIRDTLQHIAGAEYSYWRSITTGQRYRRPEGATTPTLAELPALIRESGEGLIEIAPKVQASDSVAITGEDTPRSVPSAIILTQAINHATEHRAQIMAILTQLGVKPPDLDGWSYFEAGS